MGLGLGSQLRRVDKTEWGAIEGFVGKEGHGKICIVGRILCVICMDDGLEERLLVVRSEPGWLVEEKRGPIREVL